MLKAASPYFKSALDAAAPVLKDGVSKVSSATSAPTSSAASSATSALKSSGVDVAAAVKVTSAASKTAGDTVTPFAKGAFTVRSLARALPACAYRPRAPVCCGMPVHCVL